ncbi:helicase associated domain-containing protein [Streptomyces sp. NPDC005562]|uniref:helicase associated domain-containing protein n=1 Tax=Streptomyces sp. NPDC005562 TaxID=3154890 RepID=UPI0033AAC9D7
MSINRPTLPIEPEDLDRVEELIRHLVAHDGRLPTDDMPLAWWLVEALDQPSRAPMRILLDTVPLKGLCAPLPHRRVAVWAKFVERLDQLDCMKHRGQALDDEVGKDLGTWAEGAVVRYLNGNMKVSEELLLRKRPIWSFERPLSPRRRGDAVFAIGLRAVKEFHQKHGHTDIPADLVVEGVPVEVWWRTIRDQYSKKRIKPHEQQRLEGLKLDLRSDKQIAEAKAHEEHLEARRARRRAKLAAQRGVDDLGPVLDAIRAFAEQHGHTGIPFGAATVEGIEFGRHVDRWRRQYARGPIEKDLRRALESMPHWVWVRTPRTPVERPAPVSIPEDTTRMRRAGLHQFLPAD